MRALATASTRARMATLVATLVLGLGCGLLSRGRAPRPPAPLDLNTASLRRIERLRGITPSMAKKIVDGRPYARPDDLVARGILTEHELGRIEDAVTVGKER